MGGRRLRAARLRRPRVAGASASRGRRRRSRCRSSASSGSIPPSDRARRDRRADRRQLALGAGRPALLGGRGRGVHQRPDRCRRRVLRSRRLVRSSTRLVGERLDDGGWNCERANGSVRSSFATTINVLEGLLEYETGHRRHARIPGGAQRRARSILLERSLFRRLSTGEPADERFLQFLHPEPLALRRPPGARLLPLRRRADRRRARPAARRGDRPRPVRRLGRRHVAARLDACPAASGSTSTTGRASPPGG